MASSDEESQTETEIKYLEKYELWVGNVLDSAIKAENGVKDFNKALNKVLSRYSFVKMVDASSLDHSDFNYAFVRCNSNTAFDELYNSTVTFAGHKLDIRTYHRTREETMLPNDEIELTFELMNKDVQDLENDFSAPLEANNRATPELRESVESIFSDIKKKIETIQTFDFKPKIEDAKASVKESCNKKRLKEIEKVSLNKEMIGLNKEMSNLCKRIANCEDEFETCENDVSSAKKTLDTLLTDHLERIHEIEKGMDYLLLNKEELDRTDLCTFAQTGQSFKKQPCYQCKTCYPEVDYNDADEVFAAFELFLNGVTICSACVKICHAGHDIIEYSTDHEFCDCGAKGEGSCLALKEDGSSPSHTDI